MIRHLMTMAVVAALMFVGCDEPAPANGSGSGGAAASGSGSGSAAEPEVRLFSVERGIVQYTLSGMFEGTETLYFDRWGARQATWTTRRMLKPIAGPEERSLVIHDGRWITTVDLVAGTGRRMTHPLWDSLLAMTPEARVAAIQRFTNGMGGTASGEEAFLGRTCEVTVVPMLKQRILTWKGLTLKSASELTGASTDATAIDVDVEIPADKLVAPEGVTLSEGLPPGMPKLPRR